MHINVKRLRVPAISLILAACVLLPAHVTLKAGYPHGASYDPDSSRMFWFLQASDLHIGMSGTNDTTRLQWLVTTARSVINPSFIVVTGDLTDSTNGNWLGIPNGPYQAEWDQYKSILTSAGMTAGFYYDLPGNHDAYSDAAFAYYRANSLQGRATGGTQVSWTRTFPFGTYHFLGVNSAGNDGRAFSITSPYGDYAGLDGTELTFINQALSANTSAALTFAFGHHPVSNTGNSQDTWLYYGHQEFVQALGTRSVSTYNYGHTHKTSQELFKGNSYTGLMAGDGLYYYNVASLSKDSPTGYSLVAVDANGVSSITNAVSAWPLLLITSPLDKYVGSAINPYAYTVPASSTNFVRALVFDAAAITQVWFRIDGGTNWVPMSPVATGSPVWQGVWNASGLSAGNHLIEVQATGTSTVSDSVTVEVTSAGNRPPVAAGDSYSVESGKTLTVNAPGVLANDSDPDGDAMTAEPASEPAHGTLALNANGSLTYTPTAGYAGADSFTYRAVAAGASSAAATVAITVNAAPAADTVTIVSATYNAEAKDVERDRDEQRPAELPTLTVVGYGQMTYKTKTKTYTFTAALASKPASVTVTSSRGGSATAAVN